MKQRINYCLCALLGLAGGVQAASSDIAQTPLSVTQTVRPMVLFALSKDHQLFRKAYNDYSDLDGDGAIDTTYNNSYGYYGYFDPDKCYTYNVGGYFEPTVAATSHQCSGAWSGNLLNWAAMTRIDILRRVLYGGYRSTDYPDASHAGTQTILERTLLPTDAHAFAKVFAPAGGAAELALYTPAAYAAQTAITFCNVTYPNASVESQAISTVTYPPLIRVAKGSYPLWANGEVVECPWSDVYNNGTAPASTGNADFIARVAVCVPGLLEDNCREYKDAANVVRNKPSGLIQKYGENGSLRFGLISGSYAKNKSGGVLRRKIGLVAGNTTANAALNEIDLSTGVFTNNAGIIKTINVLRINKYNYSSHNYQDGCGSPGILSFANGSCTNWGNPTAEIYAEALRYFAGKTAATSAYVADDHNYFSALTPLTWTAADDPMPVTDWCAKCNIILMSTGVNSFDRDELPSDLTGLDITAATNLIGTQESIAGNLIVGSMVGNTTTADGKCTVKTLGSGLDNALGICPEGPTIEGSFRLAGLAHYAHTTGLRRVKDHLQTINTQTVALARDLPRFQVNVGGNTVTLLPHMEANSTGSAVQGTAGWRASTLQDLVVENLIKDASGKLIGGSLLVIWEDSTWGNDYDMDGIERIKFCAGSAACNQSCATCITCNNTCATCTTGYNNCLVGYNVCNTTYTACNNAYNTCSSTYNTCNTACNSCKTTCTNCSSTCDSKYTTCYNGCGSSSTCKANCATARTTCKAACPSNCTSACAGSCACTPCTNTCTACTACATCTTQCNCTGSCPSECTMNVGDTDLQVTTSVQQANAGHALLFGYTVAGTVSGTTPTNSACDGVYHGDGVYREVVRTGGKNFSMLTIPQTTPTNQPVSCTRKFVAGTSAARLPESPLWYAAKYGGFTNIDGNALPDKTTEWDSNSDGVPDRFFYADNPAMLGTSLERFLEVIATISSSASVVANSITLNEDTRIFQGRYDSSDWSGDLVAFPVNQLDGSLSTLIWSGRSRIDSQSTANARRIITSNEDRLAVVGGPGVPFRWGNDQSNDSDGIASVQKAKLQLQPCWGASCGSDDATKGQARLDYLRGSHAAETAQVGGTLRTRIHVMGDVVNSDPVYVGPPMALYPDSLETTPYRTFATNNAGRQPIVYVGANDGMLHGFNADTGAELFAYVPRAVYPKLSAITAPDYREHHQSFVDSGAVAGDAYLKGYLGGADAWRTLLFGSLGAGGRGVFAIDVTDPADFLTSEATAATRVLWDIVGGDPGFADLGYSYSRPVAVRMPDTVYSGAWVVVFGNGYKSPDGKAVLYVVDAKTGALKTSVLADTGPGNGLSTVAPVDYDGDGRVDYLYAGDLKGNLWRFEPSEASGLKISFVGTPLFNDLTGLTGTASPITVRPEVTRHPAHGVIVLFGSGAYFREGDRIPSTTAVNAFYGIWDRLDGTSGISRQHLLKQQILAKTVSGAFDVRVTTDNPINWRLDAGKPTDSTTHLGWYLELRQPLDGTAEGEVQVTDPQLRGGRVIFTSLIPTDPAIALCDFGGDGWLMELNATNGGRRPEVVFDLTADTVFNLADMVSVQVNGSTVTLAPSGKKSTVGIIQEPAIIGAGTKEYKFASGAREAAIEITVENPGDLAGGRRSWLQLH